MSFFVIVIFLLLLLFLPDAYVVFVVMKNVSWLWKGLFLVPTAVCIFVTCRLFISGDTRQVYFNLIFILTLCFILPLLIFTIISVIGKGAALIHPVAGMVFMWLALALAAVWLCMAVYGISFGWRKITVEDVKLKFENLPGSFRGYKIVQLSDLHIGTYDLAPETVDEIVDKVNSLDPDLIVFTGDIVNMDSSEITPYADILSQLKAKDGVISILGNHDYCLYKNYEGTGDSPEKAVKRVIAKEREMGWRLLLNESLKIRRGNDEIAVIGVENSGGKNFIDRSDLKKAMEDVSADDFKILLSHDPSHWRREVIEKTDIDLTLSGHTHAMQFKIGNFSPSKWTYKEWGGLYAEGERKLHVNTGTGGNIPFRFGAYPQITLITLE